MPVDSENMVLRTLYLPQDLDRVLKSVATRSARSKGDLIRELIVAGLQEKRKEADSYYAEPKTERGPVRPSAPKGTVVAQAKPKAARKKVAA
jgi:predicted DNA-binding protein